MSKDNLPACAFYEGQKQFDAHLHSSYRVIIILVSQSQLMSTQTEEV